MVIPSKVHTFLKSRLHGIAWQERNRLQRNGVTDLWEGVGEFRLLRTPPISGGSDRMPKQDPRSSQIHPKSAIERSQNPTFALRRPVSISGCGHKFNNSISL